MRITRTFSRVMPNSRTTSSIDIPLARMIQHHSYRHLLLPGTPLERENLSPCGKDFRDHSLLDTILDQTSPLTLYQSLEKVGIHSSLLLLRKEQKREKIFPKTRRILPFCQGLMQILGKGFAQKPIDSALPFINYLGINFAVKC